MLRGRIAWKKLFVFAIIFSALMVGLNITTRTASAAGEYDWVKDLMISKVSSYDPETQTIVVLNYQRVLSEEGEKQNLDISSLKDAWFDYNVFVNDTGIPANTPYYELNQSAGTVKNKSTYTNHPDLIETTGAFDKVTVFLVNKGDTVAIKPSQFGLGNGWFYRKSNGTLYRPLTENDFAGNPQTADGDIVTADITYEVHMAKDIDLEIWMVSSELKKISNPGFIGVNSFINLKVELRDKDGNISLMPKEYVYNISNGTWVYMMEEDGLVHAQLTADTGIEDDYDGAYGEIEFHIPQGYDYRITVLDYGEEDLGQFVHFLDYSHRHDEEGFALAADSTVIDTFIELNFLPRDKKLTIKNVDESESSEIKTYYYQVFQTITGSNDAYIGNGEWEAVLFPDIKVAMSNYSYKLFDSNTNEEIETEIKHKTDKNGILTLKTNQYAVFDVYAYPMDIAEYDDDGYYSIQDYLEYTDGIDTPRPFYSEILDTSQYTKIYNGETVFTSNVATAYAGEEIVYLVQGSSSSTVNPPTYDGLTIALCGLVVFGAVSVALVRKNI